jgi:hypothetical protein
MGRRQIITVGFLVFVSLGLRTSGCLELIDLIPTDPSPVPELISRTESNPADAEKLAPEKDLFSPILHSAEWFDPVPLAGPINTAGNLYFVHHYFINGEMIEADIYVAYCKGS